MIAGLRSLRERDWRSLDRLLAAFLAVALTVDVTLSSAREGPLVLNLLVCLPMALPVLHRRDRPVAAITAYTALAAIGTIWLTGPPDLLAATLVLIILSYSVGVHAEGRASWAGLGIGAGTVVALTLVHDPSESVFATTFYCVLPWFVGRVIRGQTLLARELAEKAERAEHERRLGEARAVAEERRRVARELHDVLAHDLSVMVVQAGAARRIAAGDPERAAAAARLIERTGHEALAELRLLFGPIRRGEAGSPDGAPGLAGLGQLAERARAAGLPVELATEGEPRSLPPGIDLAAYRVIQEALTNSLKHARAGSATVSVRYLPSELVLEVADDGVGPGGAAPGPGGHGLVGMRERVALYGGELETGRRRGGGFAVRARLPLDPAAVPA